MISQITVASSKTFYVQLSQVGLGQYPLGFSLLNKKNSLVFLPTLNQSRNPIKNLVIYHI